MLALYLPYPCVIIFIFNGMTILLILFLIFIFILLFASSVILSIVRWVLSLFGIGNYNKGNRAGHTHSNTQGGNSSSTYSNTSSAGWHYSPEAEYKRRKRKKIIQQDEGEYVDYEEIKK